MTCRVGTWGALVLGLVVSASAGTCGDANGDGSLSILDALDAARHGVGLITLPLAEFRRADVDADLDVDIIDALQIAQVAAGIPMTLVCQPEPLPAPIDTSEGRFVTSQTCGTCHSNAVMATAMRDELTQPIAPYDLWQATMMANSARDPFWRAQLSAETHDTPSRALQIEQKCTSCHAPMASTEAALNGEPRPGVEIVHADTARGQIARDGVSCALCHQIQPDGLGTPASYSAGFVINDSREIYGPHAGVLTFSMFSFSGYTPAYGAQVTTSALCGSCHTLFTATLDPGGTPTGDMMPEQTPYLEWRNSAYNDEVPMPAPQAASCQACHVPTFSAQGVPIMTAIARTPGGLDYGIPDRSPFGRHLFIGGNTLLPQIFRDNAVELGVLAPPAAFDVTRQLALEQLQNQTALVTVGAIIRTVDTLTIPVQVENLTGHKFPSGYPARRAWLRVEVTDALGATVFLSGDHDAEGRLVDRAGVPLDIEAAAGPIEPHHELIDSESQVQIYETIMHDAMGMPTWRLMRAAGYGKDNRLLPLGWSTGHPDIADITPAGVGTDADYVGAAGTDNLVYEVDAPAAAGPYTVSVALLYETLSVRTAAELFTVRTGEILAFRRYYEAVDRSPVVVDSVVTPAP